MSLVSRIRERISETSHAVEQAASGAAAKAEEAAKAAAAKAKEGARAIVAEPPAPSAASLAHAARAAVDAARNASPPEAKKAAPGKNQGIFVGVGASGAAGSDVGVGGEVSAGYVVSAHGEAKTYGTTGVVSGAVGAVAGGGVEVGVIVGDVRDFYGDGYQLSICPPGAVSLNMAFTREKELTAISVGVGKSTGAGVFHFDTHTEDTTGR